MRHVDYVVDTEFVDLGDRLTGISIGVVCVQDGREFYAINRDTPDEIVSKGWLGENVWPYLPKRRGDRLDLDHPDVLDAEQMQAGLTAFFAVSAAPGYYCDEYVRNRLWAWYAAFDFVVLARFAGGFLNLGRPIPQHINDLHAHEMALDMSDFDTPPTPRDAHHALADARWGVEVGHAIGAFK